jgi:hypothetical protein
LPQKLVLAAQAPFDLGHEVFRQPQVIEGLLKGFSGLLRLAAVVREAFLCGAITAASGFGMLFGGSFVWGHDVLLCFVRVYTGRRMPTHT